MARCLNCGEKFVKKYPNQMGKFRFCLEKDDCLKEFREAVKLHNQKKQEKAREKTKTDLETQKKTDTRDNRILDLQKEVNKLARNIDYKFNLGCIDCNKKVFGVGNGAHYHNVKGNENIRFNLHNIHLSRINCNKYSSEHKKGYKENLRARYGLDYYELVEFELRKQYPSIKLSFDQVKQSLSIARKINRNFETYDLKDPISARSAFNKIIGIYT